MECTMETPLDVLSRAATMLQNEEREAAIKRSAGHPDSPHQELNGSDSPRYKRYRTSPRNNQSEGQDDHSSDDDSGNKKCMATQTSFSSFHDRPVSPGVKKYTPPPPPPPYGSLDTSHIPWQPFMVNPAIPRTSSLSGYILTSQHLPPDIHTPPNHNNQNPTTDNSMPLNLSTNNNHNRNSSSSSDSRPSVIVAPNAGGSGSTMTGMDSGSDSPRANSPGVPEKLLHGRPMTTATGGLFYPSTVAGANLAGLEARTTRKETQPDICDPSIEEHFRRSLGPAYSNYVSTTTQRSPRSSSSSPPVLSPHHPNPHNNPTPPPRRSPSRRHQSPPAHPLSPPRMSPSPTNSLESSRSSLEGNEPKNQLVSVSGTVDDHFAKALGNRTWNKIKVENESKTTDSESVDDHFAKALGATWHQLQAQRKAKPQT